VCVCVCVCVGLRECMCVCVYLWACVTEQLFGLLQKLCSLCVCGWEGGRVGGEGRARGCACECE